ncbi:MAG: hypothetical protein ACETWM_09905 [Candidatus Lokiarchaeia archaeon]
MAIKGVYVIKDTGSALFHRTYGEYDSSPDEDLISGFISAIFSFSEEFGKGQITKMETKFLKFFYHQNDKIIFVIITELENDRNESAIMKLLQTIAESFVNKFEGKIYEEIDRSKFSDFEGVVDQLIEEYDNSNNYGNNLQEENLEEIKKHFDEENSREKWACDTKNVKIEESGVLNYEKVNDTLNFDKTRHLFSEKPFAALKLLTRRFIGHTEQDNNEDAVIPDS